MPFNGSGTFTLSIGGFPYVANTTIVSANVNALIQDIANGLSLTVTRDGQMTLTGPLHMGQQLIDGIKNLQFSTTTSSPPVSSDGWFLTAAHTLGLATNGAVGISQNSTGNVSIAAPSSGTTLALTGIANGVQLSTSDGTVTGDIHTAGSNTLYFGSTSNHALNLRTNGTDRITTSNTGNVTVNAPSSGIAFQAKGLDTSPSSLFSGVTKGIRFGFTSGGSEIDGVDNTGSASFQPLSISGSTLNLGIAGSFSVGLAIAASGAITLATPTSGNHQFNGLTQYSDGTTNAEIGWRSLPSSTFSGTLVVTQRSQLLQLNGNVTVPNAVFNAGDVVVVTSTAGRTITQGASVTLTLGGTATTGSRTLAANGVATILFTSSSAALVYGAGVT